MQELYAQFIRCHSVVSTDSRRVSGGAMFFALRGDNFDGNQYAAQALKQGAAVAVVDDAAVADGSAKYIVVSDTLLALQELASHHRSQLNIPIIALTGSNGKTTTKEFLRLALGARFEHVGCTQGNLNNHIGVPLTLLGFDAQTQIGIVEMGANHPREIAALCSIARPDVGLITNIGRAHLEGFGGQDGVRRAKGELLDFLAQSGGTAIYNSEDETLSSMMAERKGLKSIAYYPSASSYTAPIFGAYNTLNALAAISIAAYFGIDKEAAAIKINTYTPANNRSQMVRTLRGNTLVVDCYNANPSSMAAAIEQFALAQSDTPKLLILGNMGELGSYCQHEHQVIETMVEDSGLKVYFVGSNWQGEHWANVELIKKHIEQHPIEDHTILLKGSRSMELEKLIENL